MSGRGALNTSIPLRSSGEIRLRSTERSVLELEGMRTPLTVMAENLGSIPRMITFCPSPPLRFSAMPGSLAMASAAFTSGSSWILSSETTFTMASEFSC